MVLIVACSGPPSSGPDASGTLDGGDAPPGAMCADGSTTDLDGDGILWCDDPVESITLTTGPLLRDIAGAVHRDAVAVLLSEGCFISDPCPHTLFAVNGHGKLLVRSDSTQPADAWVKRDALAGPFVSRYGHIYVGRRESQFVGDTVTIDPATSNVTLRGTPMLKRAIRDATNQPALGEMSIYSPTTLVEPQSDGSLTPLTDSMHGFEQISFGSDALLPMSPALFLVERNSGAVRSFRPGDIALSEISTPATAQADVTSIVTSAGVAICVASAAGVVLYEQTATTIAPTPLPFSSCSTLRTRIVGSHTLFEGRGPDLNGDGFIGNSVYRRSGSTFEPIVADKPWPLRVVGDNVIVVIEKVLDAPQPVWVYRPGSAATLVAGDLEGVDASVAGDVAHVIGVRREVGFGRPLVLIRVKTGAPNQTLELRADAGSNGGPVVVTSKEGAAIAGYISTVWIAPSTSFVAQQQVAQLAGGSVRGANTVVMMRQGVFSYREVGGVPGLISLMPLANNTGFPVFYTPIDSPVHPPTEWFKYEENFSGLCIIGRVKETGQGPTVENVGCTRTEHRVIGTSADGSLFVTDFLGNSTHRELFKLSATGPELIAMNIAGITPLHDYSRGERVIGWTSHGHKVCLDEQPRRCWNLPSNAQPIDTVLESDGSKHGVAQLLVVRSPDAAKVVIVRSIGPGD
ncbi:MAG: hypothetical protein M4D80_14885 [Myxococcota bacterium]|nr:hypothetical protein [Myxococcota bacterium]